RARRRAGCRAGLSTAFQGGCQPARCHQTRNGLGEAALVAALRAGTLGGAALDVFGAEPLKGDAAALFASCPNLVLTPHIAGVTQESNVRVSGVTVVNVLRELVRAGA
ncbi:MAG: NAD(P)-dependent oxidoreductase, partial [Alsobacter sp.]